MSISSNKLHDMAEGLSVNSSKQRRILLHARSVDAVALGSILAGILLVSTSNCGNDDSPGVTGDGGADVAPPGCDLSLDPKDSTPCIDYQVGNFVSPAGNDDANPGTKARPFKTITKALERIENKPRVYICEGTYSENVRVAASRRLYGGFSCLDWAPETRLVTVAPASGVPLTIAGTSDVTGADMTFTAPPGGAAAPSSIAAIVDQSQRIVLKRVVLTAADAEKGADGQAIPNYGSAANKGNDADTAMGGPAQPAVRTPCANGSGSTGGTQGGAGGAAGVDGGNGEPFGVYAPSPDPANTGAGGKFGGNCGSNGTGRNGSDAPAGGNGAGATKLGAITGGWIAQDGTPGEVGKVGQGGGGGGGSAVGGNAGGGGGGAGGCGGTGGGSGRGGGGSIALLSISSDLTVIAGSMTAKKAGDGGKGAGGQKGQTGGVGGLQTPGGCSGGGGGSGGNGGAGGGGAGGVSAGILHTGSPPAMQDNPSITVADKGGAAGTGSIPGTNDGVAGQAAKLLQAQ